MELRNLLFIMAGILCLQLNAIAQNSTFSSLAEFEFVRDYVERNHAGFADNVNEENRAEYDRFVVELREQIKNDPAQDHAIIYLKRYLRYFKDNHNSISSFQFSFDDQNEDLVKEFMESPIFVNREEVSLNQDAIKEYLEKSTDPIEGVYSTANGYYVVAVMKSQNSFRDYYAVILDSKTSIWPTGKVKFELKQTAENEFDGYFYYKFYSLEYERVSFDGKSLGSWTKKGAMPSTASNQAITPQQSAQHVPFRALSDSTYYLQIGSFDGRFFQMLDSLLGAHFDAIISRPNLIIDVRGNGGGSDALVELILPFIYDKPFKIELPKVYVTEDNLKVYQAILDEFGSNVDQFGEKSVNRFKRLVSKMESADYNTFISMFDNIEELGSEGSISVGGQQFDYENSLIDNGNYMEMKMNSFLKSPKRVVVIMDRGCASSCENLILFANQSDKTITVGNNSGGFKAYGNVMPVKTPGGFTLNMSTTRYADSQQFEFVGIPPDMKLDSDSDWIEQAINLMEKIE